MRRVLTAAAVMLLLGAAGGAVWSEVARPTLLLVTEQGLALTEDNAPRQFGVVVAFVAVGAAVSLLWGLAAGWRLARLGGWLVPVTVVATLLGSLLAWRLGIWLGPPETTTLRGLSAGDTVPAPLVVDAVPAFLVWPMAGLLGVLLTTYVRRGGTSGLAGDVGHDGAEDPHEVGRRESEVQTPPSA